MAPMAIEKDQSEEAGGINTRQTKQTDPTRSHLELSHFRGLVPMVALDADTTYLNASFMPPCNTVVGDALRQYVDDATYNPEIKAEWQGKAEKVRELLAEYINASPDEIAFTRDTTEALNCFIQCLQFEAGDNVIVLDSEHPNHAYGWMSLRRKGLEVRQVDTKGECFADAATFAPHVDQRTRAIGLSSVMFHSGQKNAVKDICSQFRSRGIHVLVDMTQQAGFATIDVQDLGVSAAAFSLHKGLACPTGLACLYVQPEAMETLVPHPPVVGAGAVANMRSDLTVPANEVEYHVTSRRYDHLNMGLIQACAAHASLTLYLRTLGPAAVEQTLYALGDALRDRCGRLGVAVVGRDAQEQRAPHLYVLRLQHPDWPAHFKQHRIYVSHYRLGTRVSFSWYNNVADVDRLMRVIEDGVQQGIPLS